MHDFQQAFNYVQALTGSDPNTVSLDWRAIHDTDKGANGVNISGALPHVWQQLCELNSRGYGVFTCIQQMDGRGRLLENVAAVRCHIVDLDDLATAQQAYNNAINSNPAPSFAVNTSPGKFHVYWSSAAYRDNARYETIERKLVAVFGGDPKVIDAARVLRVPGFFHMKNPLSPSLVTAHALPGYGQWHAPEALEYALQHVQVRHGSASERHELGDTKLAAPRLEWAVSALNEVDPNELDRSEWIATTSAFKQATSTLVDEETAFMLWSMWCNKYAANDPNENRKQWNSIRNTQIGWGWLSRKAPRVRAHVLLGKPTQTLPPPKPIITEPPPPKPVQQTAPVFDSEILTPEEQALYFKGCTYIERFGDILTSSGRFMGTGAFNAAYGGKVFIINGVGDTTKLAWEAATQSRIYTIPKVDHIRFVPEKPMGSFLYDALGRAGVNTYKAPNIDRRQGDVSPFVRHMELIIPDEHDRKNLLDYLAHNAKYPGVKIPWAPLIQSEEGAGKGVIKSVIKHMMGGPYVYFPKAQEMVESGSKFNAWMRSKLFIVCDEIKVDERRDMIEILKPMISEAEIEIQGKGENQETEDNYSNWIFFSNYKDAIPIRANGRRFAIYYSAIQSVNDLLVRGMDQKYFDNLYKWLEDDGGKEIVANWLYHYPIEKRAIPMRAPKTTSTLEALRQSRSTIEQLIHECVDDMQAGFRAGWVSTLAVAAQMKQHGMRAVAPKTISMVLEQMGFKYIGRAPRAYFTEDAHSRSTLYHINRNKDATDVVMFGREQGYE